MSAACGEAGVSAQPSGSGEIALQGRAGINVPAVPDGVRAAYISGDHCDRDRVFLQRGEARPDDRAFAKHGAVCPDDRAFAKHGEVCPNDRAFARRGEVFPEGRALREHGLHPEGDRAEQELDAGRGHGRAQQWHWDDDPMEGLHACGHGLSKDLPRHGVGGGGFGEGSYPGRTYGPWTESAGGSMNTKGELPDLPADSSPLQFGDWLHLITPIMKDISASAAWWWESTLREAKGFYEDWRRSSPLQKIQIQPRLPEDLQSSQFQRTEQRGIQMLLKAIPATEQQALVTDRILSSTGILFKLLVRFQPGGPGEKQLLLTHLTTFPKCKDIQEVASALRSWRRHFGRALEVEATLPDGVLLLKNLDLPQQKLATMDNQAAFRLSQSRMELQLDQKPTQKSLWAFSQCLLAEAETLALFQSSSTTSMDQAPLKLKQMQTDPKTPPRPTTSDNKLKSSPTADKPCKYFISESGCKAGRSCKWLHSWDGVDDKSQRCWLCGGKDHRKHECKARTTGKKPGDPAGSGGGNGYGRGGSGNDASTTSSSSTPGGKAGAAATPAATKVMKGKEVGSTSSTTTSKVKTGDGVEETAKGSTDGGTGGDPKSAKADDLLHEATQLLKSLRVQPKISVMQLAGLDQTEDNWVLIDSGATHALRPARDQDEWSQADRTVVQLANGATDAFRLKKGTRILLGHPTGSTSRIIPMGGIAELDFTMVWSGGECSLKDDEGRQLEVQVHNGCPMIGLEDGRRILEWLELHQIHQQRKLAMVKTMMTDESLVDKSRLNLELAFTLKLRQLFPELPDQLMMRLVPYLEMVRAENFASRLPWNRRKRRRLKKAKNVILHIFSGPGESFWTKRLSTATTEVLCVDTACATPASLLGKNIYGYLLSLCASGKVCSIIGGPPCRTVSSLRYQQDGGPGILRSDAHPYGLPTLKPEETELVLNDSTLMLRFWSLLVMAEEMRDEAQPPTQFMMEQPEDPARYRSEQDVAEHGYFSVYRTVEWQQFAAKYNLFQLHFDQFPMGHPKRKPTTLGVSDRILEELDGIRGGPSNEAESIARFKALPVKQRCEESKTWSAWAPGLKEAMIVTIQRQVQRVEGELSPVQQQPPSLASGTPERRPDSVPQRALRSLSQLALDAWKTHFLCDHLPARRDCAHCVRSQGRGRQHRRVSHPEAYTLSVDLSGKMTPGSDQGQKRCRYMMVACYTFPVTRDGAPLIHPPGDGSGLDQDQQLPPLGTEDEIMADEDGDDVPIPEDPAELADPEDPLQEQQPVSSGAEGPAQESMRTAFDVWHKLVNDAKNVAVKNVTFVEVLASRSVQDVLPALARIHSRLQALGLPLMRLHCDRARELTSAPVRRWTLDRGIVTTLTTGSSFKSNGRVEAEVGATKRAVRTIISAGLCAFEHWPLCARHIGERRLRCQLQRLGWPTGPLLQFGSKAFALRKSWQERYTQWRDAREEVVIMGPDKYSSLTTTNYYVKSIKTGKFFYTDDVVQPPADAPGDLQDEQPAVYLEERGETPSAPPWPGVPSRRLRGKTTVPAIRSLVPSEGEASVFVDHSTLGSEQAFSNAFSNVGSSQEPMVFHFAVPEKLQNHFDLENVDGSDDESWTISTDPDNTTAASQATTPSCQTDLDSGGGDVEEAPNNRCGGSCPVASYMSGQEALRTIHQNITEYINSEVSRLDATSGEQALWLPVVSEALEVKTNLEKQLKRIQCEEEQQANQCLEQEFLVTKTIGNAEVWANLKDWEDSIKKEYDQLVVKKKAVRQITKGQLQQMASEKGLPIELLPAKMVHTRKANTGAYRSRAVVCGNYAGPDESEHYAGGADGNQIRTALRLGALKSWAVGGTDIRTAFLNAPRRDETRLLAMEIPVVFRKLGLAETNQVWLIDKALYGLTTSPRDWGTYRDETIPQIAWTREREGKTVRGGFQKTPDENVWRIEEVNSETGDIIWTGLMLVYVDDLLLVAEDEVINSATKAIADVWAISEVEKAGERQVIKYCGFEIEVAENGDGYMVSQRNYEREMIKRFGIEHSMPYPNYKITENDDNPETTVTPSEIKEAQSMAGALLWLTTRTRPDIAMGVAAACRLATKNPQKSIEISTAVMQYVRANRGGLHYPQDVPAETWGMQNQLKIERHCKLLEVFSDISFGAGSRHRSLQGLLVCFAGAAVAWQSSQQAFVTYSTAEAELVSYCEALNAGRSIEALLCAMTGEQTGQNSIERVIYGDNAAAISMAQGTGTSSWRTRHLRVRSSFLKEAIDGTAPGGLWKLLHLRGTELVADGLTKPLSGQAFFRFLQDLGMRRDESQMEPQTMEMQQHGGGGGQIAAIRALVVGSMLVSQARGSELDESEDKSLDWVFATGAILVALGAVYAGQLLLDASRCCLRRMQRSSEIDAHGDLTRPTTRSRDQREVLEASEDGETSMSDREIEPISLKLSSRSGSSKCAGAGKKGASSLLKSPQSGLSTSAVREGSSSKGASMSLSLSSQLGSSTGGKGYSSSKGAPASLTTSSRSGCSSGDGVRPSSMGIRRQSGTGAWQSAGEPAAALTGLAAADESDGALDVGSIGEIGSVGDSRGGSQGSFSTNPWNLFQHAHKGRGLTSTVLSRMYQNQKSKKT